MLTLIAIAIIAAIATVGYVHLYHRYKRNVDKVRFMFNAIDNLDFTFQFPTEDVNGQDKLINQSLNRIKVIMQRYRDEALEREKYYEQIMDSVDTGIIVANQKGNVLQHNRAAMRLLGAEVLTHLDQVRQRLSDGTLSKRESEAVLKGRQVRIIAFSDINSELANQEVDSWIKLTRVLTHEIMNTVTPITSLSQTLLRNAHGEQREGLDAINRTGRELIQFVKNYRRFTHVPTPCPSLFYVKPFLERMARLTGREVQVDVEPHDMMVYADEGLIAHVVTNVLKNATQATANGGQVWMNARIGDDEAVIIDISNDGDLIPDDVAQHIFIPFFTTKADGSGIGLSLSRQIMRVSGSSITLHQTEQPRAVTFRLVLS